MFAHSPSNVELELAAVTLASVLYRHRYNRAATTGRMISLAECAYGTNMQRWNRVPLITYSVVENKWGHAVTGPTCEELHAVPSYLCAHCVAALCRPEPVFGEIGTLLQTQQAHNVRESNAGYCCKFCVSHFHQQTVHGYRGACEIRRTLCYTLHPRHTTYREYNANDAKPLLLFAWEKKGDLLH